MPLLDLVFRMFPMSWGSAHVAPPSSPSVATGQVEARFHSAQEEQRRGARLTAQPHGISCGFLLTRSRCVRLNRRGCLLKVDDHPQVPMLIHRQDFVLELDHAISDANGW